jgi:hypothetical protein
MKYSDTGNCYSNESWVPKFDHPGRMSTLDFNLGFQKFDGDSGADDGY